MRRPSGKTPTQPLTHMFEHHHEIKRRLVLGQRQKQIAEDLGMTQTRISVIANSPLMKDCIDELQDKADGVTVDIRSRLTELQDDAVNAMAEVLKKQAEPANTALRIKVAQDVLNRTGVGTTERPPEHTTLEQYVQQTLIQINNNDSGALHRQES